jgi:hypothetical protein
MEPALLPFFARKTPIYPPAPFFPQRMEKEEGTADLDLSGFGRVVGAKLVNEWAAQPDSAMLGSGIGFWDGS